MKRTLSIILVCMLLLCMVACGGKTTTQPNNQENNTNNVTNSTQSGTSNSTRPRPQKADSIEMKDLETILYTQSGYVIIDVRDPEDFAEGHISNAINIPYRDIRDTVTTKLTNLNQKIFVYGEGSRSRLAANEIARMGYTSVYSCGDIRDWTGELISDNSSYMSE